MIDDLLHSLIPLQDLMIQYSNPYSEKADKAKLASPEVVLERARRILQLLDLLSAVHVTLSVARCLYCDWKIDVAPNFEPLSGNDNAGALLRRHVENDCPNHPMRKLEGKQ